MNGTTPKIRLRNLRKSFGNKVVLDGIDLDIMPRTSTVMIGGSGSGKSVLLKCILGLIEPDAGSIEIDGADILGLPRRVAGESIRRLEFQSARWARTSSGPPQRPAGRWHSEERRRRRANGL